MDTILIEHLDKSCFLTPLRPTSNQMYWRKIHSLSANGTHSKVIISADGAHIWSIGYVLRSVQEFGQTFGNGVEVIRACPPGESWLQKRKTTGQGLFYQGLCEQETSRNLMVTSFSFLVDLLNKIGIVWRRSMFNPYANVECVLKLAILKRNSTIQCVFCLVFCWRCPKWQW